MSNRVSGARGVQPDLDSLPAYLLRNAEQCDKRVAMRHKDLGIWHEWTWQNVFEEVRSASLGFEARGLAAGDKVAIIGGNRPRLYWSFAAVQALGAVPVPVYADSVAAEMHYVLDHAGVRFAVCQDQEQVDKLLSISDQLAALELLVYDETRGLRTYPHERLVSFSALQREGAKRLAADPALACAWRQRIDALESHELCVILYTSGTTGRPKGVMISHRNLIVTSLNANRFDTLDHREQALAYLPLAWVGDHVFSYAQAYTGGYCVNCPEDETTIAADRREIAPTYFFAPPRVFETLLTSITVQMEDAGRLKKTLFDHFIGVAERYGERILDGRDVSRGARLYYRLGSFLVYEPLKNRLGMTRVRVAYTAGEAIGPDIFRFYRSLGINLKQLYGQTEASVYITAQPDGEIDADTVGKPSLDVELAVTDSGEVRYRSPGVFIGYYRNSEATAETIDADGWVSTGDAGFIDERGHLHIIDRASDVGRLADGSLFAPKYIENKLKFFPIIGEAVAFGDGRDYVGAMINIDFAPVANWAERNNIVYGSYQELAGHREVYRMVSDCVVRVNRDLGHEPHMRAARIRRFLVLHKELDPDDGELTRTQKVRRTFINDRYRVLIGALYSDREEQFVSTEVTYEDGRKGNIEATIAIRTLELDELAEPALQKAS